MIYITGDTHGNIDYEKLLILRNLGVSYNDYLIICGDAGICWSTNLFPFLLGLYKDLGLTVLFIDGNHENFTMLNQCEIVEYCGALMHRIDDHIFHVLRGEIVTLENKRFLCIGGAVSIDKGYRKAYETWWPEEEITFHDIDNALENLSKVNNEVDYVITHCCDTKTSQKAFGFKGDICTKQLKFIDETVKYKQWFFGHYHFDRQVDKKKRCVYQKILQITG